MKMNKMVGMALVMMVAGSITVFAAGIGERPDGVEQGRRFTADTTEVTVSGTVEYRGDYPVLVSGDKAYSLSARGGALYSDDLVDGMELTVTGERIEALESSRSGADYHVFVASAQANGETIDFDARGAGNMAGANGGRVAGRGNGYDDGQQRGMGRQSTDPRNGRGGNTGRGNSGRGTGGRGTAAPRGGRS